VRKIRLAPFALRVVERKGGKAAIVYRRTVDSKGQDRLQRLAALSPLAFTAATPMLREAVKESAIGRRQPVMTSQTLTIGAFHPLDTDWGARVACYGIIAAGLRNAERLLQSANHLRRSDPNEAAWWLGLLTRNGRVRALRALRILTEAVK
jgi:hypothetical protein